MNQLRANRKGNVREWRQLIVARNKFTEDFLFSASGKQFNKTEVSLVSLTNSALCRELHLQYKD